MIFPSKLVLLKEEQAVNKEKDLRRNGNGRNRQN